MQRSPVVCLTLILILLTVSCGRQGAPSATTATTVVGAPISFMGPLVSRVDYSEPGVTLLPPGTASAAVGPESADQACASGKAVCGEGPATSQLALATVYGSGTINKDNSTTPLLKDKLVYVLTWPDFLCVPAGGPPPTVSGGGSVQKSRCGGVVLIDANSGTDLYNFRVSKA